MDTMRTIRLSRYLNPEALTELLSKVLEEVLELPIEVIFTFMAGFMCLLTSSMSYYNEHIQHVRMVLIGQGESDVIASNCLLLLLVGLLSITIAVLKASRKLPQLNFNKFLLLLGMCMFFNFVIATFLSDYKRQVIEGLNADMFRRLNLSIHYRQLKAVSSPLSSLSSSSSLLDTEAGMQLIDSWDTIQSKLSCCGVDTYSDYMTLSGVKKADQILPVSCCSNYYRRKLSYSSEHASSSVSPSAHNFNQCYLDARLEVFSSLFLHTEGCHGKLSRWMVRLLNKMMSLIYVGMFLQACGIFYMSAIAYRKLLRS